MSRHRFLVGFLLATLLLAGVASYYASAHPDGLEHVAERAGFADTADNSAAADSPLADYATEGVGDERVSVGLSGVIGCVVVLVIALGVFRLVRRRPADDAGAAEDDDERAGV